MIAVKNIEESKKIYHDILDMNMLGDFGANVQLDGGLYLYRLDTGSSFINNKEVILKNNAGELYFEVSDIDEFYKKPQVGFLQDSPGYGLPEGTAGRNGVDMRQEGWIWSGVYGACVMRR